MSETNNINFILDASGFQLNLPNAVYQASGNLIVGYTINGAPSSMTITVEGISSPATNAANDYGAQAGSPVLLDTYSSTANTSNRTIAVSSLYDSFRVTGKWAGGNNVTVNGSLQMSGAGPTWNSETLPSFQSYTGH